MPRLNILMVDDSADDRLLYARALQTWEGLEIEFHEAEDIDQALKVVREHGPLDCCLLDFNLPGMNGATLLLGLREAMGTLPCTCIMLTGTREERAIVESVRAGAWDYLIKDSLTAEELRLAVERAAQVTQLQRDLASQQQQWEAAQERLRGAALAAAELEGVRKAVATFMHELNSPLTGLLNCTLMLLEDKPSQEHRQWLGEMLDACQRMTHVLKRLGELEELRPRPGAGPSGPLDLQTRLHDSSSGRAQ